mmetsp:Transcript_43531/g.137729  ORF Transcript_43531/g.137729 Transcript_43531/m.137729 type:complete len:254 (+) Transcript_43531:258-1019(+)
MDESFVKDRRVGGGREKEEVRQGVTSSRWSRTCGIENFCLSALDLSYPECRKTLLDIDLFTTVLLLLLNLSILSRPSSSFLFFSCFFPPPLLSSLPSSRISPRPLSSPFLLTLSSLFYSHPPPGAWYVPVDSWKDMVTDARRRQTRSRNGPLLSLSRPRLLLLHDCILAVSAASKESNLLRSPPPPLSLSPPPISLSLRCSSSSRRPCLSSRCRRCRKHAADDGEGGGETDEPDGEGTGRDCKASRKQDVRGG